MPKEILAPYRQLQVKQILEGSKTMTRRPLRVQPKTLKSKLITLAETTDKDERKYEGWNYWAEVDGLNINRSTQSGYFHPRFKPGDIMTVRERVRLIDTTHQFDGWHWKFKYEADGAYSGWVKWPDRIKEIGMGNCCPNGCFKELVRIKRKVLRVWYEQARNIRDEDILAEGIYERCGDVIPSIKEYCCGDEFWTTKPIVAYQRLIESIYPKAWEDNIWFECTEFEGPKIIK